MVVYWNSILCRIDKGRLSINSTREQFSYHCETFTACHPCLGCAKPVTAPQGLHVAPVSESVHELPLSKDASDWMLSFHLDAGCVSVSIIVNIGPKPLGDSSSDFSQSCPPRHRGSQPCFHHVSTKMPGKRLDNWFTVDANCLTWSKQILAYLQLSFIFYKLALFENHFHVLPDIKKQATAKHSS